MGNSSLPATYGPRISVHPHVHGELDLGRLVVVDRRGSSPRAWGTHSPAYPQARTRRFIPTCMGNSALHRLRDRKTTVHPHVHGELVLRGSGIGIQGGSSPRAWGTHTLSIYYDRKCRFIPTCMGNSISVIRIVVSRTVHPHVHGELMLYEDGIQVAVGSSPRAWGTLIDFPDLDRPDRFIPTCMGNSRRSRSVGVSLPVHPHVHGELWSSRREKRQKNGSSPRAWGTLSAYPLHCRPARFIPTCMGNSSTRSRRSM